MGLPALPWDIGPVPLALFAASLVCYIYSLIRRNGATGMVLFSAWQIGVFGAAALLASAYSQNDDYLLMLFVVQFLGALVFGGLVLIAKILGPTPTPIFSDPIHSENYNPLLASVIMIIFITLNTILFKANGPYEDCYSKKSSYNIGKCVSKHDIFGAMILFFSVSMALDAWGVFVFL